jgi:ribosomal protein S18 acetylase RimI-like enzyme
MKRGTTLSLHVEKDNIPAVKCYEKCGFKYGAFNKEENTITMHYK